MGSRIVKTRRGKGGNADAIVGGGGGVGQSLGDQAAYWRWYYIQ